MYAYVIHIIDTGTRETDFPCALRRGISYNGATRAHVKQTMAAEQFGISGAKQSVLA